MLPPSFPLREEMLPKELPRNKPLPPALTQQCSHRLKLRPKPKPRLKLQLVLVLLLELLPKPPLPQMHRPTRLPNTSLRISLREASL